MTSLPSSSVLSKNDNSERNTPSCTDDAEDDSLLHPLTPRDEEEHVATVPAATETNIGAEIYLVSSNASTADQSSETSSVTTIQKDQGEDEEEEKTKELLRPFTAPNSAITKKKVYKHGFEPGDHIIRWEMLPIAYPIQIHGIVLETLKEGGIVIADFGLSSCENEENSDTDDKNKSVGDDSGGGGAEKGPNASTDEEKEEESNSDDEQQEEKVVEKTNNEATTTTTITDETTKANSSQNESENNIETHNTTKKEKEDAKTKEAERVILAAWDKIRPKDKKKRLNIIQLTSEKDLKRWSKVNYGGSMFSFSSSGDLKGEATAKKDEQNKEEGSSQLEDGAVVGSSFLQKTAKSFVSSAGGVVGGISNSLHSSLSSLNVPLKTISPSSPSLQCNSANDNEQQQQQQQQQQQKEAVELKSLQINTSILSTQPSEALQSASYPSQSNNAIQQRQDQSLIEEVADYLTENESNIKNNCGGSNDKNDHSIKNKDTHKFDDNDRPKTLQELINEANAVNRTTQRSCQVIGPSSNSPKNKENGSSIVTTSTATSCSAEQKQSKPVVPLNNYGATKAGSAARIERKRSPMVKSLSSSFSSWSGGFVASVGAVGEKATSIIGKSSTAKQSTTGATNNNIINNGDKNSPSSANSNGNGNNSPKKTLPKSDPAKLVLARTNFLLQHGESILPPYHVFDSNSECIAVWCKTGTWSTLQASIFLHTSAIGHAKSSIALGLTVAAVQPWLVPAMAGMGLAAVSMPWMLLWSAKGKWKETTKRLTDEFWRQADNEVYVECIKAWSGLV